MNSMGLSFDLNDHSLLHISKIVNTSKSFLNIKKVVTQQQLEVRDCGLFAIVYDLEECLGNTLDDVNFEQNEMHHHLLLCLEEGKL